jgi:hypothetical protein
MDDEHRLTLGVAGDIPVNEVAIAYIEQTLLVGLARRVAVAH